MRPQDLLHPAPAGLYCPIGDFYVDPLRPVERALITHGHSDHARPGHAKVMASHETLAIMKARLGAGFCQSAETVAAGETRSINGVEVAFHPAGHVLGSCQIAIAHKGLTIVVSGDYKRERDPTCAGFALARCHVFISEATFGLPVFRHPPAHREVAKLLHSIAAFPSQTHLVGAYALGKAQRIIALLREAGYERPIHIHGALEKLCTLYEEEGVALGPLVPARDADAKTLRGEIVICPPGSLNDLWSRKFGDSITAFASGWMRVRARARQRGVELPLIVSDHADWDDLTCTIAETGCEELWVTHGEGDALVHWATGRGLNARPLHLVGYGEEEVSS